jgi:tetratricopeptide (TPR) repeat protein
VYRLPRVSGGVVVKDFAFLEVTMRRLGFVFTLFCLLIAACAAPPADIPTASPGPSAEATATPSATASHALDLTPNTLTPDTPTITPLPTIPTFTPTFDVRTIATATPAPKAECPQVTPLPENTDLGFLDLSFEQKENILSIEKNLLAFLNQYGHDALYKIITANNLPYFTDVRLEDWTNDGEPEMIFGAIWFFVFGCQDGEYASLLKIDPTWELDVPKLFSITDSNRDNIPDITLRIFTSTQGAKKYQIYQWNGVKFANLLLSEDKDYPDSGNFWIEPEGTIQYKDIDKNLIQELVIDIGIPTASNYFLGLPWRNERIIYFWNGKHYVIGHKEFSNPEFLFQAVQDGDLALSQQEYDKAVDLYEQAIFNPNLNGFSVEIGQHLQNSWQEPSPTPISPDSTEYPRLAAYAYYRMLILHTFLGETEAAQVKYATLQEKFPAESPGHPYVEMATDFWDAYQSSGLMYDACAAAIAYADAHPEILIPLGSDYHGWQSHTYTPADVCPFR